MGTGCAGCRRVERTNTTPSVCADSASYGEISSVVTNYDVVRVVASTMAWHGIVYPLTELRFNVKNTPCCSISYSLVTKYLSIKDEFGG